MGLRNLDLDSAIRCICHGNPESFTALLETCNAKMKQCGLKAAPGEAVAKAPRHGGRRNPLRGQFRGSGDLNVRSLVDFVESIEPLPKLPAVAEGEEAPPLPPGYAEMETAHEALLTIQATIVAHA